MPGTHFTEPVLARLRTTKTLRIRAGRGSHRLIGIWMVVVENRLFVRSWTVEPDGWFHTFRREGRGLIEIGNRRMAVRVVHTRSSRLKDAVSRAYAQKYKTPGSRQYVRGFRTTQRKNATLEVIPI